MKRPAASSTRRASSAAIEKADMSRIAFLRLSFMAATETMATGGSSKASHMLSKAAFFWACTAPAVFVADFAADFWALLA